MTKLLKYRKKFRKLAEKAHGEGIDILFFYKKIDEEGKGHLLTGWSGGVEKALSELTALLNEETNEND